MVGISGLNHGAAPIVAIKVLEAPTLLTLNSCNWSSVEPYTSSPAKRRSKLPGGRPEEFNYSKINGLYKLVSLDGNFL